MTDRNYNAEIAKFVRDASKSGLPTFLLTQALRKCTFSSISNDKDQGTTDNGRLIKLQAGDYDAIGGILNGPRVAGAAFEAVGSIYHEATHALLWDAAVGGPYQIPFQAAEKFYRGTRLTDGTYLKSENDVSLYVDEVFAEYVDHRVAAWWSTYNNIESAVHSEDRDPVRIEKNLETIRNHYEALILAANAGESVGYIKKGIFFKSELRAASPLYIPPSIATWVDQVLFEGKIKQHFDENKAFREAISSAGVDQLPAFRIQLAPTQIHHNAVAAPRDQRPKGNYSENSRPLLKNEAVRQPVKKNNDIFRDQQRRNQDQLRLNEEQKRRERERRLLNEFSAADHHRREVERRRTHESLHNRRDYSSHSKKHSIPHSTYNPNHSRPNGTHVNGIHRRDEPIHSVHKHPVHQSHRPHIHNKVNPFGVQGSFGIMQVGVQNNSTGAWTYQPPTKIKI